MLKKREVGKIEITLKEAKGIPSSRWNGQLLDTTEALAGVYWREAEGSKHQHWRDTEVLSGSGYDMISVEYR